MRKGKQAESSMNIGEEEAKDLILLTIVDLSKDAEDLTVSGLIGLGS